MEFLTEESPYMQTASQSLIIRLYSSEMKHKEISHLAQNAAKLLLLGHSLLSGVGTTMPLCCLPGIANSINAKAGRKQNQNLILLRPGGSVTLLKGRQICHLWRSKGGYEQRALCGVQVCCILFQHIKRPSSIKYHCQGVFFVYSEWLQMHCVLD